MNRKSCRPGLPILFAGCVVFLAVTVPLASRAATLREVPVLFGIENVSRENVVAMLSEFDGWTGNEALFNSIGRVSYQRVRVGEHVCSFMMLLDTFQGQFTCLHLESADENYSRIWTAGRPGTDQQYATRGPSGFDHYSYHIAGGNSLSQVVYIADTHNARVKRISHTTHNYDARGRAEADEWNWQPGDFAAGSFRMPVDVSVLGGGTGGGHLVAVCDYGACMVRMFAQDGTPVVDMDVSGATVGMDTGFRPRLVQMFQEGGETLGAIVYDDDATGFRNLATISWNGSSWSEVGSVSESAIDITYSESLGLFVLASDGTVRQYDKSLAMLGAYVVPPLDGIQYSGIAIDGDDLVIVGGYSTGRSGIRRFKVIGGPSFVAVNRETAVRGDGNLECNFAISGPGWYRLVVDQVGPGGWYVVPGWSPVFLDAGTYSVPLETNAIAWNADAVVRLIQVVSESDLTPLDAKDSQHFAVVSRPQVVINAPQHQAFLDGSTCTVEYSLEFSLRGAVAATEVWLFNGASGAMLPGPYAIWYGDPLGRGSLSLTFVWPTVDQEQCEYDYGIALKVLYEAGGERYEQMAWGFDGSFVPNSVICSDPPAGGGKPKPCIAPCFYNGTFSNGKSVFVMGSPCIGSATVLCARTGTSAGRFLGVYDIRGRKLGEILPEIEYAGYWSATIRPTRLGMAAGVYFLVSESGDERTVERLVVLK